MHILLLLDCVPLLYVALKLTYLTAVFKCLKVLGLIWCDYAFYCNFGASAVWWRRTEIGTEKFFRLVLDVNRGGEVGYITANVWWACCFLKRRDENDDRHYYRNIQFISRLHNYYLGGDGTMFNI